MTPRHVAGLAAAAGAVLAYIWVGPWPCARMEAPRCGLVAYHYGSDVTLFPYQAVVTMSVFALAFGVVAWFWRAGERSPLGIKLAAGAVLFSVALLSIAGIGGWIGIGAPFVVPILWLAAQDSSRWARVLWTVLAGFCAAAGSWLIALALDVDWTQPLAVGCAVVTIGLFVLTTRSRPSRSPQSLGNLLR